MSQYVVDRLMDDSLDWMSVCHSVFFIPGWKESIGARAEMKLAVELELHIVEVEDGDTQDVLQDYVTDAGAFSAQRPRIYVAGRYTSCCEGNPVELLRNIHNGAKWVRRIRQAGGNTFNPWGDCIELMCGGLDE